MNVDTLSAIAEKMIQNKTGALRDYENTHLDFFKKQGFVQSEDYKFTKLESFFESLDLTGSGTKDDIEKLSASPFPTLLFVNGELKKSVQLPSLTIKPLEQSSLQFLSDKNALSHLHHALLTDGVMIEVNKEAEGVILRILHLHTKPNLTAPTVIMKVGALSQVTLLEENIGTNTIGYAEVSENIIHLEEGSQVEHVQIDRGQNGSIHHGSTQVNAAKDANYRNVVFHVSGKLNRRNLELNLQGSGANGESYNLFLTDKDEHSDIHTLINHEVPDTTSNQVAKGILDGDSKGIFTGKIHIHPKAQRVVSGQLNKNLLLSKKAQVHSQPQLEIFADDVKCSHGSTTGQLSDDEVFYFQARGIPEDKARTLLAYGFGLEIVQKIKEKQVQKYVSDLIKDALKTKFKLGGDHESHNK